MPARLSPHLPTLLLPGALADAQWPGLGATPSPLAGTALAGLARRVEVIDAAPPAGRPPFEPAHLRWLHARLGLAEDESACACSAGPDGAAGAHWRADPIHLHLGRDHLLLTDPARLALPPGDARALADAIAPLFADDGLELLADGPRWYLRETDPSRPLRLRTRSLHGALGRNVDAWMPVGEDARRWKRLLNEAQMTWFVHEVNARREAAGEPVVNGLWIDGRVPRAVTAEAGAVARALDRDGRAAGATRVEHDGAPIVVDTRLLEARLDGDPRRWAQAWRAVDAGSVAPIAAAAPPWDGGARIVLAGETGWRTLQVAPRAGWRFWRRADPAEWLAEPAADDAAAAR